MSDDNFGGEVAAGFVVVAGGDDVAGVLLVVVVVGSGLGVSYMQLQCLRLRLTLVFDVEGGGVYVYLISIEGLTVWLVGYRVELFFSSSSYGLIAYRLLTQINYGDNQNKKKKNNKYKSC